MDFNTPEFTLAGREVSCFALQYVFLELERRGQSVEELAHRLPYTVEHLRDGKQRVDWATLCKVAHHCEALWGRGAFFELGTRAHTSPLVRWMTIVARALFTPVEYYRFGAREFCRKFACIESSLREIDAGWIRIHMVMREGYPPCAALFDALAGGFTFMPTLLGMPAADVVLEHLPNGAVFDVRMVPGGGRLAWLRRFVTWPVAARWAASELRDAHAALHERYCELVRKDTTLRESERNLRALMEQASDAIVISDPELVIVDVNMRACDALGYPREKLLGMRAARLLKVSEADDPPTPLVHGTAPGAPVETAIPRANGGALPVEISSTRLDDGRLLWIVRDISIRKRIEEDRKRHQEELELQLELQARELERAHAQSQELQRRVLRAEQLRAAEDLAASLAHAVNNPLAALIGTLQMAREEVGGSAPTTRHALRLAERIRRIVAQTLQLFQKGSLDLARECPRSLLHDVREELLERAQAQQIGIRIEATGPLPRLEVDRALVTTALVAIAENGIEAMGAGGTLTLCATALPSVPVVRIAILDEGKGIPPELRDRVFEPFFTTKGGGTGLGLAIAHGIIHGHGGRIQIGDAPKGGLVTVELRAAPAGPGLPAAGPRPR